MTTHWLELDVEPLRSVLPFYETRPHLFAYYQDPDTLLPAALRELHLTVPAPFYIDFMTDERGAVADTRVVSLIEHPVVVEG